MSNFQCSNVALLVGSLLLPSATGFVTPQSASQPPLKVAPAPRMTSTRSGSIVLKSAVAIDQDTTLTNNGASYIRWGTRSSTETSSDIWELQTAVTTFERINPDTKKAEKVELHAQVHYGDRDYFNFYNTPEFTEQQDEVLYELLVNDDLLALSKDKSGRVLTQPLQASINDASLANDYGWQCQVNVMDYTQPNWKHADFTRQELLQQQNIGGGGDPNRPLWEQVSSSGTAFWQPAVSALMEGPPSLFRTGEASTSTKRKLFTNLFLPGNQLTGWLRATLWMTVPAPEISVLLLDWSSLFLSKNSPAKFSPVTLPILQAVMTLKLTQLRQLVFGQVLVSGNSGASTTSSSQQQQQNQDWDLLVTQRNDHALNVLKSSLKSSSNNKMALLYGCSHCPDLHNKLVRDMGFSARKTEWRTAWSVSVPKTFQGGSSNSATSGESLVADMATYLPPTAWAAMLALFPLYLGVGAVDWIDTIHSSAVSLLDHNDAAAFGGDWMLYILRHVLLYVGVSKFALEWQDPK